MLGVWAGIVTAISEAIGTSQPSMRVGGCQLLRMGTDLGNLDDNLTLPVLAGAGIWAYLAFLRLIDTGLRSIPQL